MKKKRTLKDVLKDKLPEEIISQINRSFELVGDIAILEIEEELREYENDIAKALLELNSHIKTVLRKDGRHQGEFRVQNMLWLAGEKKEETVYLEHGIRLKVNPATVYFSARLSTERGQLMDKLKAGKRALIMFSGCGPYTFVALKKQPNLERIDSIEINPEGHRLALENVNLNKNLLKHSNFFKEMTEFFKKEEIPYRENTLLSNLNRAKIHFFCGDVREVCKKNLKISEQKAYIEVTDNWIFNLEAKKCFEKLSTYPEPNLTLDARQGFSKETLFFLIHFFDTFSFDLLIDEEKIVHLENDYEKGHLFSIAKKQSPKEAREYDEIFMPLPKDAHNFLDCAFSLAAPNCQVHMYDFVHDEEFPQKTKQRISEAAAKSGTEVEIKEIRKVGQYSPHKFRVCADFVVKKKTLD